MENYARFYLLLKRLTGADKESLVHQFTNGRTTHLHQMTDREYNEMCRRMEEVAGYDERRRAMREELRRNRSVVLKLMQVWGIDTTSWMAINKFCENKRIAGKPFGKLKPEELRQLSIKLRAMINKKEKEQ